IFTNHFRRHFVADRSGEVSVFPELAAPELPLDLRELPKHRPRAQALEPCDHLRDGVARRERAEQMNMVRPDFRLVYRDAVSLGYLPKHLLDSRRKCARQNVLAVLWRPDQVVRSVVGGVSGSSKNHARILSTSIILRAGIEPAHKMVHPSPPQAAGH